MIAAKLAALLAAALGGVASLAVIAVGANDDRREVGYGQVRFRGLGPEAWAARWRREHRALQAARHRFTMLSGQLEAMDARTAIRLVFGPYASQALAVAWCETGGTMSTTAMNGQYLGLFQMGSNERARYGYGLSPFSQTLGAYVYFVVSGRGWGPWACRP